MRRLLPLCSDEFRRFLEEIRRSPKRGAERTSSSSLRFASSREEGYRGISRKRRVWVVSLSSFSVLLCQPIERTRTTARW